MIQFDQKKLDPVYATALLKAERNFQAERKGFFEVKRNPNYSRLIHFDPFRSEMIQFDPKKLILLITLLKDERNYHAKRKWFSQVKIGVKIEIRKRLSSKLLLFFASKQSDWLKNW